MKDVYEAFNIPKTLLTNHYERTMKGIKEDQYLYLSQKKTI